MRSELEILSARPDSSLLALPWHTPLEQWPEELLHALPRGLSRHVVRFVRLDRRIVAVKEINADLARREYRLLRATAKLGLPGVRAVAVVSGRRNEAGEPLDAVLITEHLQFALPYRILFGQFLRKDTEARLIDALAVLIVRAHLIGFFWGDISLSNALFRRDAGAFSAYLVDAETGDLHAELSPGQRAYDLDLAHTNLTGELMDLQAGEFLDPDVDVFELGTRLVSRYEELWETLTGSEDYAATEQWRVDSRIEQLNELGFDVDEFEVSTDLDGTRVQITPKIVDAGHHQRRLLRLTGLDAEENQARRLLNDLDGFRSTTGQEYEDESYVAREWLTDVFEPVVRAVPREMRKKAAPPEIFHEVLEHRWYLAENLRSDVGLLDAADSYIHLVLQHRPDEQAVVGTETGSLPIEGAAN